MHAVPWELLSKLWRVCVVGGAVTSTILLGRKTLSDLLSLDHAALSFPLCKTGNISQMPITVSKVKSMNALGVRAEFLSPQEALGAIPQLHLNQA